MSDKIYRNVKSPGKGLEKFFGELQLAIMKVVWEQQPVSVSDVLTALNQKKRHLAYTTVMTILNRLTEKGWLKAEKQGRAFLYRAAYSREEAEATAVGEVVRALLNDFGDVAIAQFVKELDGSVSEQLSHLADLMREAEKHDDQ